MAKYDDLGLGDAPPLDDYPIAAGMRDRTLVTVSGVLLAGRDPVELVRRVQEAASKFKETTYADKPGRFLPTSRVLRVIAEITYSHVYSKQEMEEFLARRMGRG